MRQTALLIILASLAACSRAPKVRFDHDACFIDDAQATLVQVETEEALISQHMAERAPLFVLVTVLVVVLAGAGYVLRIVDVIATRSDGGASFVDRLRAALERHQAHPVRYFSMIAGTFVLLLVASGFYLSLDSDKRASERGLATLQFCHLALRTAEEHNVLSEQRQNLEALSATAGHIRELVDQLPPDEQQKAQLVISQVSRALDKQSKELANSFDKSSREAAETRDRLKNVPAQLSDLQKTQEKFDEELSAVNAKLAKSAQADSIEVERAELSALAKKLDAVSNKLDKSAETDTAAELRVALGALAKRLDSIEARMPAPAPNQAPSPSDAKPQ